MNTDILVDMGKNRASKVLLSADLGIHNTAIREARRRFSTRVISIMQTVSLLGWYVKNLNGVGPIGNRPSTD